MNVDTMWGFSIEAELVENKDKQDELCCFVSRVEERSVASGNGKKTCSCPFVRYFGRDVTIGATGATEVAHKFLDTLTLSPTGGADSAHHRRGRI